MISFYQNRKCKTFLFPIFCGNFFTYFEKYQPATEPAITRCCAATTNWVIQRRPNIWYLYIYIRGESKKMARTKIHETFFSENMYIFIQKIIFYHLQLQSKGFYFNIKSQKIVQNIFDEFMNSKNRSFKNFIAIFFKILHY